MSPELFAFVCFSLGAVTGAFLSWLYGPKGPIYVVIPPKEGGEIMRFGDACMDDLIWCVERRRTNDNHKGETP
jgi:hypothetical protein